MMFDWNDEEQAGVTIWGELNDSEDHIVPEDPEKNIVFTFDDHSKKPSNQAANSTATPTGQSSRAKIEFPESILPNNSNLNSGNEHSGPRLDMDTWSDLLSLNSELTTREFPSLDGESELFGNVHGEKERDNFLGCDWDNIGDFDDLHMIFRDDSIFGHDMIPNVDDYLSLSAELPSNTSQSIHISDIPLSGGGDQGCSTFRSIEHAGGKRKAEDKRADIFETGEQTIHQTQHTNQFTEKDDKKKKLLKSRKKADERSKNKAWEMLDGSWSQNNTQNQQFSVPNVQPSNETPSQTVHSFSFTQTRPVSDSDCQFISSQYGYPAYRFSGTPILQHVQVPEIQSQPMAMTPQEKIEKLRRRQQAQAMVAIQQQQQQQQQQLVHQNIRELDESALTDENSKRTIYYQLQDTVGKLDTRVRLCIRDSLLRLARSSMQRQNACEKIITNTTTRDDAGISATEEANHGKRHTILQDEETYTNPIDRTVAHLLFHKPLDSCMTSMNDGMPRSCFLHNPVSKLPLNISGKMSEREPVIFGEMELLPSMSK